MQGHSSPVSFDCTFLVNTGKETSRFNGKRFQRQTRTETLEIASERGDKACVKRSLSNVTHSPPIAIPKSARRPIKVCTNGNVNEPGNPYVHQ